MLDCRSVNCLKSQEMAAIEKAKSSADKGKLLEIKHMAERYVPLDIGSGQTSFWLFYLPDFTNIFRDWYCRYTAGIIETYKTNAHACIHRSAEYFLLKYCGQRPKELVLKKLEENPKWIYDLISEVHKSEADCSRELWKFENNLKNSSAPDVAELIDKVNNFAAYGLDNVFPENYFVKKFPFAYLSGLYPNNLSSWLMIWEKAVTCLDAVYNKEKTEGQAAQEIADISYLRWGDMESKEDDLKFAQRYMGRLKISFPNWFSICDYREKKKEDERINLNLSRHISYANEISAQMNANDKEIFKSMAYFACESIAYNEKRRINFTKCLRLLRDYCEQRDIDWRVARLEDLVLNN